MEQSYAGLNLKISHNYTQRMQKTTEFGELEAKINPN